MELRAKRWLDREEFREILKIADYNGYIKGIGSVFTFNIEKALRNNYSYEDVLNLIKNYDLEVDDAKQIERLYDKLSIIIEWDHRDGYISIYIPRQILSRLFRIIRLFRCRYRGEDNTYAKYLLIPYKLEEFIDEIQRTINVSIVDKSNLLNEKKIPLNLELRNIKLRDYQEEALEKWLSNRGKGIIALPTGSGKTIIGIAAITRINARTLIITYTREQMFQWRESIYKYTNIEPGYIGLIYSDEKRLAPITITTYQSGYRNIKRISPLYDLLIVDEVHHLPADKFRYIAIHSISKYRMGLSATVVREDGKHEELFPLLGGIVYHRTAAELAQQGYLARYRVVTVKVKLKKDEAELYRMLRKKYRLLAGYRPFNEVLNAALHGDERAREALSIHNKMKNIVSRSRSKIDKAVEIALKELRRGKKIIIFTQYVKQAEEIAEKLNAYLLTGEIPAEKRKQILREFREASSGILVVTTVGDEGLDIPDANVGIIVSGTGSRRQFIQRLGRILRPKKGEAILYEIVLVNTMEEYQARRRKRLDLDDFV